MKSSLFLSATLIALSAGTAAQASCWSNKAICQAICGQDCCDDWHLATPTSPERLQEISVDDLKAELKGMRASSKNRAFMSAVEGEIKTRGMSTISN